MIHNLLQALFVGHEAIAQWMFRQRPNPEQAIKHLEDAALELHRASKN